MTKSERKLWMSLQIRKNKKFFFHKYSTERQDGTFERTGALKSLGTVTLKKKTTELLDPPRTCSVSSEWSWRDIFSVNHRNHGKPLHVLWTHAGAQHTLYSIAGAYTSHTLGQSQVLNLLYKSRRCSPFYMLRSRWCSTFFKELLVLHIL